ncbi:MAG: hypothetical protein J0I12_05330 [Candidatus Eremiobacteraeota bacterium]|nr:hypothetical protein [Candidatus Eremiobacteraeota bacterium]
MKKLLLWFILQPALLGIVSAQTPAEAILARHQNVFDQKKAVVQRIETEQTEGAELLADYRRIKSKNLPEETFRELVNQGVSTTPPVALPVLVTPPVTPEERPILESEKLSDGTSYLKLVEDLDKRFPDAEFSAFCQSNQLLLRRNRWLRGKLGKL